jgi:hypothetical protein
MYFQMSETRSLLSHKWKTPVIPAEAGIQKFNRNNWIPASAGMTPEVLTR